MESKYNVGDKVRVIARYDGHYFEIGEIVTLYKSCGKKNWSGGGSDDYWLLNEEEFVPIKDELVVDNSKRYVFEKEIDNINDGVYFKITDTKTGLKQSDHEIQLDDYSNRTIFNEAVQVATDEMQFRCKQLNQVYDDGMNDKDKTVDIDFNKDEKVIDNYYGDKESPYEAIKIINNLNLNFNRGNVLKYILRAGKKDADKEIQDLQKAKNYIDYEIERLKNS